jgi:hypothetical protein
MRKEVHRPKNDQCQQDAIQQVFPFFFQGNWVA